ncbi:MAG: hypothetical protein AB8G23_14275 [Myxococcota bacterium]
MNSTESPTSPHTSKPQRTLLRTCVRAAGFVSLSLSLAFSVGCGVQVYNFGGAGRGSQFHIPATAAMNKNPVTQSWIAYSLAKSTCQLEIGGELPSANHSFRCELQPREVLVKRWATRNPVDSNGSVTTNNTHNTDNTDDNTDASSDHVANEHDEYLDLLLRVQQAGFLEEYVWFYFHKRAWPMPDWLEMQAFENWRTQNLAWHRPETRIIGYWIEASSAEATDSGRPASLTRPTSKTQPPPLSRER